MFVVEGVQVPSGMKKVNESKQIPSLKMTSQKLTGGSATKRTTKRKFSDHCSKKAISNQRGKQHKKRYFALTRTRFELARFPIAVSS